MISGLSQSLSLDCLSRRYSDRVQYRVAAFSRAATIVVETARFMGANVVAAAAGQGLSLGPVSVLSYHSYYERAPGQHPAAAVA